MKYIYTAVFTPNEDSTKFYARIPDLPGCITTGSSLQDAIDEITDAASGWILTELEEGNTYPAASDISKIKVPKGSFSSLLLLDMDSYAKKSINIIYQPLTMMSIGICYLKEKMYFWMDFHHLHLISINCKYTN